MKDFQYSLGTVLADAWESRGVSTHSIYRQSGVTPGLMSNLKHGKKNAGFETISRVCEVIDVSPVVIVACYEFEKDKPADQRVPVTSYIREFEKTGLIRQFHETSADTLDQPAAPATNEPGSSLTL